MAKKAMKAPPFKKAADKKTDKPAPKAKGKSKAKKTSNALAEASVSPGSQRQNISIRKIANGYVTSQSGMRGDKYIERETFTKAKPRVVIGGAGDK